MDYFFDSKDKQGAKACFACVFAVKENGKFDMFFIKDGFSSFYMSRLHTDLDDLKVIENHFFSGDFMLPELVLQKGGRYLVDLFDRDGNFGYREVYKAFGDFYRVQSVDGKLGWALRRGAYYPDPD